MIAALLIYLLGIVATVIHPTTITDITWIARKNIYLLILPPLLIAFQDKQNRALGLAGLLMGFWISFLLTMYENGWRWSGERTDGATWLLDLWGTLCALFAIFLLPMVFNQKSAITLRLLLSVTILAALLMVIMTAARAPLLGAAIAGGIYLLLQQRRVLFIICVMLFASYIPLKSLYPVQLSSFETRLMSITDIKNDESNLIRLYLWKLALAKSTYQLTNDTTTLLFGSGPKNHINDYRLFFEETGKLSPAEKEFLSMHGYPSNEVHNMYLDAIGKMGILWTLSALLLFVSIAVEGYKRFIPNQYQTIGASMVIGTWLIAGIFSDLLPHWASFWVVFFATWALRDGFQIKR